MNSAFTVIQRPTESYGRKTWDLYSYLLGLRYGLIQSRQGYDFMEYVESVIRALCAEEGKATKIKMEKKLARGHRRRPRR